METTPLSKVALARSSVRFARKGSIHHRVDQPAEPGEFGKRFERGARLRDDRVTVTLCENCRGAILSERKSAKMPCYDIGDSSVNRVTNPQHHIWCVALPGSSLASRSVTCYLTKQSITYGFSSNSAPLRTIRMYRTIHRVRGTFSDLKCVMHCDCCFAPAVPALNVSRGDILKRIDV
jgi:hypothetical protein